MYWVWFWTGILVLLVSWWIFSRPKKHKNWVPEHSKQAWAQISGNEVIVHDVVYADYYGPLKCKVEHKTKHYNLDELKQVYFAIEYFFVNAGSKKLKLAHAFLIFEFEGDEFLAISVAGRRVKGEVIGFSRILPHKNEIIYKIIRADDTVHARGYWEKDEVQIFKLNLSKAQAQKLFVSLLKEATKLKDKPAFFDTFTRNCTSELIKHMKRAGIKLPFLHHCYIFTNGIVKLLYKKGLIATSLPEHEFEARHSIKKLVQNRSNPDGLMVEVREYLEKVNS